MSRFGRSASSRDIAVLRRFDGQHVEAGAGDLARFQRFDQRLLIDKAAARRVDEDRILLHLFQFGGADDVAGLLSERTMQRDDIAFAQDRVEIDLAGEVIDIGGEITFMPKASAREPTDLPSAP